MSWNKVCWNGCSFTVGDGFPKDQQEHFVYRFLVDKHFGFTSDCRAISGNSNYKIFMQSAQAIMSKKYDIVFTQWSAFNRLWLHPGPDAEFIVNLPHDRDYAYKNIYLDKKDIKRLKDQLSVLNHDYQNILDLIEYCNILESLSIHNRTKIVFINGLVPWTADLNNTVDETDLGSSLTDYTKAMLDFDQRDDHEISKFFGILQKEFATLNQLLWVNIFDSMRRAIVDVGPEGHHPGVKTHQNMYNKILTYLEENQ